MQGRIDAIVSTPRTEPPAVTTPLPLFVDLDGTLIRSDLLVESFVAGLGRGTLAAALASLFRGRAAVKSTIGELARVDPATLPYRPEVLDFLRAERLRGRVLILATAADQLPAQRSPPTSGCLTRCWPATAART